MEVLQKLDAAGPGYYPELSKDKTELQKEIGDVSHAVQMQKREDPDKAQEKASWRIVSRGARKVLTEGSRSKGA